MPRWSWSGAVALWLAVCVGGAFFVAMWGVTFQETPITTQGAAMLNTLGGALIGGVVSWLGRGVLDHEDERTGRQKGQTMTTTPDEPRDPATNPDRDLTSDPQDLDATVETTGDETDTDGSGEIPRPRR